MTRGIEDASKSMGHALGFGKGKDKDKDKPKAALLELQQVAGALGQRNAASGGPSSAEDSPRPPAQVAPVG